MNNDNFNIQIKGLFGLHKNTIIEFDGTGIVLSVSLNIEPEMQEYLRKDAIFKGDKYLVYSVKKHIPSRFVDQYNIYRVHNYLLHNAMTNCREAKIKIIEKQIEKLKTTKQFRYVLR